MFKRIRNAKTMIMEMKFLRFLRWTFFFPMLIYLCLFLVKYNYGIPLKGKGITSMQEDPNAHNRLLSELNDANVDKNRGDKSSTKRIKRIGLSPEDEERMRDFQRSENYQPKILLADIFHRADVNSDDYLEIQELAKWIHARITEHINRALKNNILMFTAIDNNPANGEISWKEYHAFFLKSNGFDENYVISHNKRHPDLSRSLKETIMRDRARWAEAARTDPDKLTLDEFLAFTHPESSHPALLQMVDEMLEKFDQDGDEQLTEDEFASLPTNGVALYLHKDEENPKETKNDDRRMEFRHLIDKNKNGKADKAELLMYVDPQNPRHAIQEAQHLITLSDVNHDGKLNLNEVLSKMDQFMGSKMVDTEKSFHDEF